MGSGNRKQDKIYILVVEDRFSRWVEAVAMASQEALTVAKFCVRKLFHGLESWISSAQTLLCIL